MVRRSVMRQLELFTAHQCGTAVGGPAIGGTAVGAVAVGSREQRAEPYFVLIDRGWFEIRSAPITSTVRRSKTYAGGGGTRLGCLVTATCASTITARVCVDDHTQCGRR